jgi:hypothetical protein
MVSSTYALSRLSLAASNIGEKFLTKQRNPDVETALQYLMWALEHVERAGNRKAADHARLAIKALSKIEPHKIDDSAS